MEQNKLFVNPRSSLASSIESTETRKVAGIEIKVR
jgi:hypothetical protein